MIRRSARAAAVASLLLGDGCCDTAAATRPVSRMRACAERSPWFPNRNHQPLVRVSALRRPMPANAWLTRRVGLARASTSNALHG
jgi:hypothetical protein